MAIILTMLMGGQPTLAADNTQASSITSASISLGNPPSNPDFNQLAFDQFPPLTTSGSFLEGSAQRTWQAGQTPDQVLTFADITELNPQALTLEAIGSGVAQDLGASPLSDFPLLAQQSVANLLTAVPTLSGFEVESLPPIAALFRDTDLRQGLTLFQALQQTPDLAQRSLNQIDLRAWAINTLPGVIQTALGDFPGFEAATLDQVPGIPELPLSSFPSPLALVGGTTMQIDFIWGPKEGERTRTISGSEQQGFAVPCYVERQDCSSIELQTLGSGSQALDGSHWVSGKYQEVEGGSGLLRAVNGGKEPTGRHPYGPLFKQVIWEPDETTDTVSSALFFRACALGGCTPYVIGPFPFITYRINDPIFVGALEGDAPSQTPSTPTGATRGGGMPGVRNLALGGTFDPNCLLRSTPRGSNRSPQGIDLGLLAHAIGAIESQGSGGYNAVGVHVCADGGRNCGRGLGKYQFMSYNPYAVELISARPGGSEFLARVNGGHRPTSDELMQFFPPEDQDRAFESALASNIERASGQIDPTTGQPFQGDRLIERAAQMHFGGPGSAIDGGSSDAHGRLSLRDYGQRTRELYQQGGGSSQCPTGASGAAGQANGELVYPVAGQFPVTSEFGPRPAPCSGCSSNHAGIDLATPVGTPTVAADGGTITFAGISGSLTRGYGRVVYIDHGNGRQTRYAHLDRIDVVEGQQVGQGELIGTTGNTGSSTGPHLHFEVRENGVPRNPRDYINF
ncbi:M23 family metallopeptidase [Leptolyngbya sp. PCC 6406]|uniref:M23 family metallopeptidase n=1 Tax=Leptolyngbya sp. PCC 6406 TaxID=1173264 RepID=UPI001CEC6852|nr:M23 family metallopeptidase [Leptolyngbya sp. PCC 6406]